MQFSCYQTSLALCLALLYYTIWIVLPLITYNMPSVIILPSKFKSGNRVAKGQRWRVQMSPLDSHGLLSLGEARLVSPRWKSGPQSRRQKQTQIRSGGTRSRGNVQNGLGATAGVADFICLFSVDRSVRPYRHYYWQNCDAYRCSCPTARDLCSSVFIYTSC